jgi:hypothetical protein
MKRSGWECSISATQDITLTGRSVKHFIPGDGVSTLRLFHAHMEEVNRVNFQYLMGPIPQDKDEANRDYLKYRDYFETKVQDMDKPVVFGGVYDTELQDWTRTDEDGDEILDFGKFKKEFYLNVHVTDSEIREILVDSLKRVTPHVFVVDGKVIAGRYKGAPNYSPPLSNSNIKSLRLQLDFDPVEDDKLKNYASSLKAGSKNGKLAFPLRSSKNVLPAVGQVNNSPKIKKGIDKVREDDYKRMQDFYKILDFSSLRANAPQDPLIDEYKRSYSSHEKVSVLSKLDDALIGSDANKAGSIIVNHAKDLGALAYCLTVANSRYTVGDEGTLVKSGRVVLY